MQRPAANESKALTTTQAAKAAAFRRLGRTATVSPYSVSVSASSAEPGRGRKKEPLPPLQRRRTRSVSGASPVRCGGEASPRLLPTKADASSKARRAGGSGRGGVARSAPLPTIAGSGSAAGAARRRIPRESSPSLLAASSAEKAEESEKSETADAGRGRLAVSVGWKPPAPPRLPPPPVPEPKKRYLQLGHRLPQPYKEGVCISPPPGECGIAAAGATRGPLMPPRVRPCRRPRDAGA